MDQAVWTDIDQAIRIWIRQYSMEIDQAIRIWIRQYGSGSMELDQVLKNKDLDHAVWRQIMQ